MDYGAGYYKNVYGGLLWSVYNGLLWDEYAGYYDSVWTVTMECVMGYYGTCMQVTMIVHERLLWMVCDGLLWSMDNGLL